MGFKHLKRFGQHFLRDESVSSQIADFLKEAYSENTDILEIGPGEGVLTQYFHDENWKDVYHLCEIDNRLIDRLTENFPLFSSNIINADILKLDLSETFAQKLILFGNYPYNISSQIIFKMLGARDQVEVLIGMFQKEVSDRICSDHGSKNYGILSVLVNAYYDSENLLEVHENAFVPPPKVKSAVIKLTRHIDKFEIKDHSNLKKLVKNTFGLRRKKIRNSARGLNFNQTEFTDRCMELRPEQMSVQDYIHLSNEMIDS